MIGRLHMGELPAVIVVEDMTELKYLWHVLNINKSYIYERIKYVENNTGPHRVCVPDMGKVEDFKMWDEVDNLLIDLGEKRE